ncbi:MAG TPA: flippase activity-associated protein Agl23 [Verrucomicrobiae bacterium]
MSRIKITITQPPSKIRWAIFCVIALLALAVRLAQLGERPMHTDEAVNAYITGELLAGESFHYDPRDRHGPALFILAKPVAQLCGAKNFPELTETQLRLTPVLLGSAMILLFGAGVEWFGFIACLVAALLFAFAPLPLYYNRYFIHETLFVAATLGLVLSGGRMLKTNSFSSAVLAGFCAALMLACKETAVLHFLALGLAAAIGWRFRAAGKMPSHRTWLTAALTFLVAGILLFTWGGQNWPALADLFRAIPNFAARAGGEGHEKPIWYYVVLLAGGRSSAVILGLAALGMVRAFRPPRQMFLASYALFIAVIYSAIPYKTPWLAMNLWLPLAILAGFAVEWLWLAAPKFSVRALILAFTVALGILIGHDTRQWVFQFPADEKNPYAYAHTGEDLLRLPVRLEQLVLENTNSNPRIAVVAADAWPLPWYLRKYSQVGFWQPGQETGDADFFITTTDVSGELAGRLKGFRPEYFGARPNVLLILWSPQKNASSHE